MWDSFCKVQAVCWQGEPNWLGWIVLAIGAVVAMAIAINLFVAVALLLAPRGPANRVAPHPADRQAVYVAIVAGVVAFIMLALGWLS